ncbi:hypothetical protein KX00_1418 [Francisella sp. TX07-6608]|nr:hypothetical protein KX00_1418 [Francisella sp. TX07-6608]
MISYKKMPQGVLQINIIQIFSTVGYAVLMGLLNFYLTDHGGFTKTQANTLTASFFALNFLLHFLGGALGGKFFSQNLRYNAKILVKLLQTKRYIF